MSFRTTLLVAATAVLVAGCMGQARQVPAQAPGSARQPVTIVAAGDIACPSFDPEFRGGRGIKDACQQAATARLVEQAKPAAVLVLGDAQYDYGLATEFRDSYVPTWGRFRAITHPAIGNHEYKDGRAHYYFRYFGRSAGSPSEGWYSFDIGAWHVVALNTNCAFVGGCQAGSRQERWLRRDLRRNARRCTLAFMHHPLFSSSLHGSGNSVRDLWSTLYEYRTDVVLAGHDHVYERFAPQSPSGDATRDGIREFIVGSGGKEHYHIASRIPHSVAADDHTFGVLRMELRRTGYSWRFLPIPGGHQHDAGHATCR